MPFVTLNNGVRMPILSAGLYQVTAKEATAMVPMALRIGFTHIDASINYGNQPETGVALQPYARSSYFLLTKIDPSWPDYQAGKYRSMTAESAYDDTINQLKQCLDDLKVSQLDVVLVHWPPKTCKASQEAWRAMEAFYAAGKARAIGVSNYAPSDLDCLLRTATVVPALNQVLYHVGMGTDLDGLLSYQASRNITVQAFSPLGGGSTGKPRTNELISGSLVTSIGLKHGKSGAQVSVRWLVQKGIPTAVESTNEAHLAADLDVFDFVLSDEDMAVLDAAA